MLQCILWCTPLLWIERETSVQQISKKGQFLRLHIRQAFACRHQTGSEIAGGLREC